MTLESGSGLGDYVALIRRRWLYVATIVPGAIFIALVFAYGLPVLYQSSATLILEQSSIQEKLISTSVASYADQQIELVQARVMETATLEKLMQTSDLYPSRKAWSAADKAREILLNTQIERVDAVTLEPLKKSNAFSIHYANPNPVLAAEGTRLLADLFLTYHQKVRAEAARDAESFLAQQAGSLNEQLAKLDQEVSQLEAAYGGTLPEARERNQGAQAQAERELEGLQRDLRNAQEKESLFSIQLAGLSPRMLTRSGDLTDLATVRAQLAEAQQKYTPDHPDVKRLQRAMETLQAQGAAGGGNSSAVKADNPEYMRVAGQLEAARRDVSALTASVARASARVSQYSGRIQLTPKVDQQYQEIARHRKTLQDQYQDIQTKLSEARLGQMVESQQKGERFSMVRAPIVPSSAWSPNRMGLVLLGVALGLLICAVTLAVVESADQSVHGTKDLHLGGQFGVLGAVPEILIDADRRRRVRLVGGLAAAYIVAGLIVIGLTARAEVLSRSPGSAMPTAAPGEDAQ